MGRTNCAPQVPSAGTSTVNAPISAGNVAEEVVRLRAALQREVPQHTVDDPDSEQTWTNRAKVALDAAHFMIERAQLLVAVDRNPRIQELRVILARPDGPWEVIGGSKVSTGQTLTAWNSGSAIRRRKAAFAFRPA
jgi:hypothetical protein